MAIPAASQKIQLPASSATSAPAIIPNTTPSSEIFFFIAFSITVDNSFNRRQAAANLPASIVTLRRPWLCQREARLHQAVPAWALGLCRQSASP
jgi:hypothetical protein